MGVRERTLSVARQKGSRASAYIDGDKVYERTDNLGFAAPKDGAAHWDGGIYNTELGISNNRTRTVYISNLSVGRKWAFVGYRPVTDLAEQ